MVEALYQNPGLPLAASFLFGTVAGLLLAAWIIYLHWMIERHMQRQGSTIRGHAALEEAALEIDEDKMLCAVCWEGRHPGKEWSFQRRSFCREHLRSEEEPAIPIHDAENKVYALE